ncbi:DNA-binding protein [Olivibacter sp. SDN3]|nr:DNA-binding protein [Olivibacter sp. SDN3]
MILVLRLVMGVFFVVPFISLGQQKDLPSNMEFTQAHGYDESNPWMFWYWMHASFSREAITADLHAMKEVGIAGAYLAPIKGKTDPPLFEPAIETMSAEWWEILRYTMEEADRLGIKIALLPNDGFATAGGPWISPELSMQKVVWTDTTIAGEQRVAFRLPMPEAYEDYYEDIAVYAFPSKYNRRVREVPHVTTNTGADAQFLAVADNQKNFSSGEPCWIQYSYREEVFCRAIKIDIQGFNYQAGRLIVQVSNDGETFREVTRLVPPRAGWLDWDVGVTHAIEPIQAKYFRFVYDPIGSEPGGEDLDAAKWKPSLKLSGITLLSSPRIHQFEGKSGMVWRISEPTGNITQITEEKGIAQQDLIDLRPYMQADGELAWDAPAGEWTVLRMGHTSTGHKNETAGAGKGLECDKFNPEAVRLQFNGWFNKAVEIAGPELAARVLKIFHVDSWECGSQNWSPVFKEEFKKKRGYDPVHYLPAMAGYPVESMDTSERFLYDVRKTIAELINDQFFDTLADLVREKGAVFTAETTAPVMVTDGMEHFKKVDIPMGEFWLRSPSHDKLNDILDATSAAHVYGKSVVQAEAFTQIRMQWDEHPGNLKTLQDRNYALGINKLVYHVYVHNPWMDRKPGMTLDGIGLYFQRDQTWWRQGKAWVDYAARSQCLLQEGVPVADIAVFTGEELPRRAVLPDRLVETLPGVFGEERLEQEQIRLANEALPMQKIAGVTTSAHMVQPEHWVNPLNGYAYDSFNPDVLLNLAEVRDGQIVLPGGAAYKILVFPAKHAMQPNYQAMSLAVLQKLWNLVYKGATVVIADKPKTTLGLQANLKEEKELRQLAQQLWEGPFEEVIIDGQLLSVKKIGKGRLVKAPYLLHTFDQLGVPQDVIFTKKDGTSAYNLGYNHRKAGAKEIYFLTNQLAEEREVMVSLRVAGKVPVFFDAVNNEKKPVKQWKFNKGRTEIPVRLAANASLFILLEEPTDTETHHEGLNWEIFKEHSAIDGPWQVQFDPDFGGPDKPVIFEKLLDWSKHENPAVRYYSGSATYSKTFQWDGKASNVWLKLEELANIATVKINGKNCGTLWTAPYSVNVTTALKEGDNEIEIIVSNTWANRIIGDQSVSEDKRITHTTAPYRLGDQPLLKAGLIGRVIFLIEDMNN